jgi:predicted nucleic acid binding AN1-type Zn finger protein
LSQTQTHQGQAGWHLHSTTLQLPNEKQVEDLPEGLCNSAGTREHNQTVRRHISYTVRVAQYMKQQRYPKQSQRVLDIRVLKQTAVTWLVASQACVGNCSVFDIIKPATI